jgi:pimeloyl-ACP methyl ester carboxylesterase
MLLHHRVTGSGPALLLLHSTACDSGQWDAQRDALAADHTVVTPDLRGFGGSPMPPEPYSDAEDVLALLDHLGIARTAVVGSSGGGHVALQLASAVPDRVSALVLLCAAAPGVERTPDVQEYGEREEALLLAGDIEAATALNVRTWLGPDADGPTRERFVAMQRHAFEVQLAAGEEAVGRDLDVDLARVTAPATVVCGAKDLAFFRDVAHHLAAGLPAARLLELPWAGHLPNLQRPDETTELIRRAIGPAPSSS